MITTSVLKNKITKGLVVLMLVFLSTFFASHIYAVNVGESYGGGTVFCVSKTADTTKCTTKGCGDYGLIMANTDQVNYDSSPNHGVTWASASTSVSGALSLDDGVGNTKAIVAAFPSDTTSNNAAKAASSYTGGGYNDWYLPSKNELNKMYLYASANNLIKTDCHPVSMMQRLMNVDNLDCKADYWSSTEYSNTNAETQFFVNGAQTNYAKTDSNFLVRAIRAFEAREWRFVNGLRYETIRSLAGAAYATTSGEIYKSTDGGNSWTAVNSGLPMFSYSGGMCELNGAIYVGLDKGIYKTTDGGKNWTPSGLAGKAITALHSMNNELYAGEFKTLYKSTDFGVSWTQVNSSKFVGTGMITDINSLNGAIYVGTYWGGLYKSSDGGANWTLLSNGIPSTYLTVSSIYVADSKIYVTAFDNGVYKSIDDGASWTSINNGLTDIHHYRSATVNTICKLNGVLYLGTSTVLALVYKSTDDGANWQSISGGLPPGIMGVDAVYPISGTLFAGTMSGLFKYVSPSVCPNDTSEASSYAPSKLSSILLMLGGAGLLF